MKAAHRLSKEHLRIGFLRPVRVQCDSPDDRSPKYASQVGTFEPQKPHFELQGTESASVHEARSTATVSHSIPSSARSTEQGSDRPAVAGAPRPALLVADLGLFGDAQRVFDGGQEVLGGDLAGGLRIGGEVDA